MRKPSLTVGQSPRLSKKEILFIPENYTCWGSTGAPSGVGCLPKFHGLSFSPWRLPYSLDIQWISHDLWTNPTSIKITHPAPPQWGIPVVPGKHAPSAKALALVDWSENSGNHDLPHQIQYERFLRIFESGKWMKMVRMAGPKNLLLRWSNKIPQWLNQVAEIGLNMPGRACWLLLNGTGWHIQFLLILNRTKITTCYSMFAEKQLLLKKKKIKQTCNMLVSFFWKGVSFLARFTKSVPPQDFMSVRDPSLRHQMREVEHPASQKIQERTMVWRHLSEVGITIFDHDKRYKRDNSRKTIRPSLPHSRRSTSSLWSILGFRHLKHSWA